MFKVETSTSYMFCPGQPHQEAGKGVRITPRAFSLVSLTLFMLGSSVPALAAPFSPATVTKNSPSTPAPALMAGGTYADFQKTVQPFLEKHCYDCHDDQDSEGNVRLDVLTTEDSLVKGIPTLEKAIKMLEARKMPPKTEPRPTEDEYQAVTSWIGAYTNNYYMSGPIDPGRVTLHRLNRAEYNNTIRDLLGIDFKPADAFPVDDAGYGFDNNGDVLSIAPVLLEKYIKAASLSLDKSLHADPVRPPPVKQWLAASAEGDFPKSDPAAVVNSRNGSGGRAKPNPIGRVFEYYGNIYQDYDFPMDGTYVINFRAYGTQGADGPAKAAFYVDSQLVTQTPIQVNTTVDNARVFATGPIHVTAGKHRVYLSFRSNTTKEDYLAAVAKAKATADAAKIAADAAAKDAANQVAANPTAPTDVKAVDGGTSATAGTPATPVAAATNNPPSATDANAAVVAATPAAQPVTATPAAQPAPANPQATGAAALIAATNPATAANGIRGAAPIAAAGTAGARGNANRGGRPPPPKSVTGNATLAVIYYEIEGPEEVTPDRMPESYHKVMIVQPSDKTTKAEAAEQIIRNFATRAFRRPVTDDEVYSLMSLWSAADSTKRPFEDSIAVALEAVLASPNFLFRVEQDPLPGEKDNVHTLSDYELASRLSYFLWSSMPDDELFNLAAKGKLRANLDAQVERMLKDPKSEALVDNFAGQWLRLRQVNNVSPDPKLYPGFDEDLRESMLTETQMFFSSIKNEDRDIMDFIGANYSFVNERLAKFYGIPGITGDDFKRVTFPADSPRGGIITQASVLTITSYNNRTSPVQRGKWVLENLLDAAPPPPPPNVPQLEAQHQLTGTLRQQMEQHRSNPTCAACHERMDGIGFSLENFDAIGQWRDKDTSNVAIDASGTLPDGVSFNGASQLKKILLLKKDQFCRCMADKMLIYALGRGTEPSDKRTIDQIVTETQTHGDKFSSLVKAIVHSDAFQKRRGLTPENLVQTGTTPKSGDNS